jgi:hypothetical protein
MSMSPGKRMTFSQRPLATMQIARLAHSKSTTKNAMLHFSIGNTQESDEPTNPTGM